MRRGSPNDSKRANERTGEGGMAWGWEWRQEVARLRKCQEKDWRRNEVSDRLVTADEIISQIRLVTDAAACRSFSRSSECRVRCSTQRRLQTGGGRQSEPRGAVRHKRHLPASPDSHWLRSDVSPSLSRARRACNFVLLATLPAAVACFYRFRSPQTKSTAGERTVHSDLSRVADANWPVARAGGRPRIIASAHFQRHIAARSKWWPALYVTPALHLVSLGGDLSRPSSAAP